MVTVEEVKHIAKLSRLSLSEKELQSFQKDMNDILGYVEILQKIDTSKTPELVRDFGGMREDKIRPSLSQEKILKNSAKHDGESFVVPKVVD